MDSSVVAGGQSEAGRDDAANISQVNSPSNNKFNNSSGMVIEDIEDKSVTKRSKKSSGKKKKKKIGSKKVEELAPEEDIQVNDIKMAAFGVALNEE